MDKEIMEKYWSCVRFDEGSLYQSREYEETAADIKRVKNLIADIFGDQILPLLEEYTDAVYGEMELEARHYFEQGYLMRS